MNANSGYFTFVLRNSTCEKRIASIRVIVCMWGSFSSEDDDRKGVAVTPHQSWRWRGHAPRISRGIRELFSQAGKVARAAKQYAKELVCDSHFIKCTLKSNPPMTKSC